MKTAKKAVTFRQLRIAANKLSRWLDSIPPEAWEYGPPKPPPERKPLAFYAGKRKAARIQRTPKWADHDAIARIYRECDRLTRLTGIQHHVDHILPLQGKNVSGLHVAENLQILTSTENLRKHNRYDC